MCASVVKRIIHPALGPLDLLDYRSRGVITTYEDLMMVWANEAKGESVLLRAPAHMFRAADVVWSPWTLNGIVINTDVFLCRRLLNRDVGFMDDVVEMSFLNSDCCNLIYNDRSFLESFFLIHQIVWQPYFVFHLAEYLCQQSCCTFLRSWLHDTEEKPCEGHCPANTCSKCPPILCYALHGQAFFKTRREYVGSMNDIIRHLLFPFSPYTGPMFTCSMSSCRFGWMLAVVRAVCKNKH